MLPSNRNGDLNEGCSSQLYTQLLRKPEKKSGLYKSEMHNDK